MNKILLLLLMLLVEIIIIISTNNINNFNKWKCKTMIVYRICNSNIEQIKHIKKNVMYINFNIVNHCSIMIQDTMCSKGINLLKENEKIIITNLIIKTNISFIQNCYPKVPYKNLSRPCREQNKTLISLVLSEILTSSIYCYKENLLSKKLQKAKNIWFIEEDAILSGKQENFFYFYEKNNADLITSNGPFNATTEGSGECSSKINNKYWWAIDMRNFGKDKDISFSWLFVSRFSHRLLTTIHYEYLNKGLVGHAEMLPSTVCNISIIECKMNKIKDDFINGCCNPGWFGCNGELLKFENKNKTQWFHPIK